MISILTISIASFYPDGWGRKRGKVRGRKWKSNNDLLPRNNILQRNKLELPNVWIRCFFPGTEGTPINARCFFAGQPSGLFQTFVNPTQTILKTTRIGFQILEWYLTKINQLAPFYYSKILLERSLDYIYYIYIYIYVFTFTTTDYFTVQLRAESSVPLSYLKAFWTSTLHIF